MEEEVNEKACVHCNEVMCSVCENKTCDDTHLNTLKCREWRDRRAGYYCGFQDGFKEGCNKANEWHFVKDGDLPKDEEYKWCVSSRGCPYVARYEELFVSWTNQENKEVCCPSAWKEIVLPKESE